MTMISTEILKCAVCGKAAKHDRLDSTNEFGWADLDLRPPPDRRHRLGLEIQHCAACGYCAPTISQEKDPIDPSIRQTMQSAQYQLSLHDKQLPNTARYFVCWALLAYAQGHIAWAAWATLKAAWVCDDHSSHAEMATQLRELAASRFHAAIAAQDWPCAGEPLSHAVLVDILRRSGQFDLALAKANSALLTAPATQENEGAIDLLRFQLTLCANRDSTRHNIGEARHASPNAQLYEARAHARKSAWEMARLAEQQATMPERFLEVLREKAPPLFMNFGKSTTPAPEACGSAAQSSNHDLAERLLSQFPMPYSIKIILLANLDAYAWPADVCAAALGLAILQQLKGTSQTLTTTEAILGAVCSDHQDVVAYLRYCFRSTSPQEWRYVPPQSAAEYPMHAFVGTDQA